MKIFNFEKNNMIPLTNERKESYEETKIFYICKKNRKCTNDKNFCKVIKDHCHHTDIKRCCP